MQQRLTLLILVQGHEKHFRRPIELRAGRGHGIGSLGEVRIFPGEEMVNSREMRDRSA